MKDKLLIDGLVATILIKIGELMKCPHCKKELILPDHAILNMESYHKPVKTLTICCGKIVDVQPIFSYQASKNKEDDVDDWGNQEIMQVCKACKSKLGSQYIVNGKPCQFCDWVKRMKNE